jgi:hypothetical protein
MFLRRNNKGGMTAKKIISQPHFGIDTLSFLTILFLKELGDQTSELTSKSL